MKPSNDQRSVLGKKYKIDGQEISVSSVTVENNGKPKELDCWEKEFYKNYRNKLVQTLDSTTKIDWIIDVHEFINETLTQQRTELLEEKIERVKKLKTLTIGLITEIKLVELSDVLSILEEE